MSTTTPPNPPPLPAHLQPDREIHVIISTHSGTHTAQPYYTTTLLPYLSQTPFTLTPGEDFFVHTTTSPQSIISLTHSTILFNATRGVKQTLLLLSGDGGVVDIVNTMATTLMRASDDSRPPSIFFKPVIVLLPCGTANALAWSAGIARDPIGTLTRGRARGVPGFEVTMSPGARLIVDEGRGREEVEGWSPEGKVVMYGVVVFSWGLHASLVALSDTSEYRKLGVQRFQRAAKELLEGNHVYRGRVRVRRGGEGEEEWRDLLYSGKSSSESGSKSAETETETGTGSGEHAYVLATMVSNLEEKFRISPASEPLDGKMRLVAFGPQTSDEVMRVLQLAYQEGKHVEETDVVRYEEIENLRIDFDEEEAVWRQVCVDGKIMEVEKGGWVEVRRLPGYGVDGRRVVELVCPR